jgi:hypothetical protein
MTTPVTAATQTDPTAASATQTEPVAKSATPTQKSTQSQPSSSNSTPTDTVQISSAAKAALQEATETQAQSVREAQNGDTQAQRLLAREAAARKAQH